MASITPDTDIDKYMSDKYRDLHERTGIGFGDGSTKTGWGMTFFFIRKDGSLYIDVIPLLVSQAQTLQRLAPEVFDIIIGHFEQTENIGTKTYSVGTELYYKH